MPRVCFFTGSKTSSGNVLKRRGKASVRAIRSGLVEKPLRRKFVYTRPRREATVS